MKIIPLKAKLYDINFQEVPEVKVVKRKASKNLAFNDQIEEPKEVHELEEPPKRYSKSLSFEPELKVPQKKYSKSLSFDDRVEYSVEGDVFHQVRISSLLQKILRSEIA